jgi:hypothetical protein
MNEQIVELKQQIYLIARDEAILDKQLMSIENGEYSLKTPGVYSPWYVSTWPTSKTWSSIREYGVSFI